MRHRRRYLKDSPHDVYRIYDASGHLLYVGCSWNAFSRVPQHKCDYQPWWPDAATVDIDTFADFTTARMVEAQAIASESPIGNRAKESMALVRGRGIDPVTIDAFRGIPIAEFWKEA